MPPPPTPTPTPTPEPDYDAPVGLQPYSSFSGYASYASYSPSAIVGSCGRAFQYWDPIQEAALAVGADPEIMAALLVVEGSGERAVSPAGAMGLMQLMPDKFRPGDDPFHIPTNLMRAAQHIALLQSIYGPNERVAAAYFGAINRAGEITGASDGNVDGFEYVRRYESARACVLAGLGVPGSAIGQLVSPLGIPITSRHISFGFLDNYGLALATYIRGAHGVQQYGTRHLAWDLIIPAAPANGRGSPVFSPLAGRIIRTSDPVGGPNGIWIENSSLDLRVRLMHMDALAPGITTGSNVQPGQWVGVLGGQGTEGFPHLHISLELMSTGERLDPARFFFRQDVSPLVAAAGNAVPQSSVANNRVTLGGHLSVARIPGVSPSTLGSSGSTVVWVQPETTGAQLMGYDVDLGWMFRIGSAVAGEHARPAITGDTVVWLSGEQLPYTGRDGLSFANVHSIDLSTGLESRLSPAPGHYKHLVASGPNVAWISQAGSSQTIHLHNLETGVHRVPVWIIGDLRDLTLDGDWLVFTRQDADAEPVIEAYNVENHQVQTVAQGRVSQPAVADSSVYWVSQLGSGDEGLILGRDLTTGENRSLGLPPAQRIGLRASDNVLLWVEEGPAEQTLRLHGLSSSEQLVLATAPRGTQLDPAFGNGTVAWRDEAGELTFVALQEWDVPRGRFYADQVGERPWVGRSGHTITDDEGISFWKDYQRLGGSLLGRPLSNRFMLADGLVYQLTERGLLQWHPDRESAVLANGLELMEALGHDSWLYQHGQIPMPISDDGAAGNLMLARQTRLAWITDPVILQQFRANPDPAHISTWSTEDSIALYGLPMSLPEDFGPFVAQRFQRAVFRHWHGNSSAPPTPQESAVVNVGALFRQLVLAGGSEEEEID